MPKCKKSPLQKNKDKQDSNEQTNTYCRYFCSSDIESAVFKVKSGKITLYECQTIGFGVLCSTVKKVLELSSGGRPYNRLRKRRIDSSEKCLNDIHNEPSCNTSY